MYLHATKRMALLDQACITGYKYTPISVPATECSWFQDTGRRPVGVACPISVLCTNSSTLYTFILCATAALCTATLQTKRCTMCHRSTLYSYITDKEVYYVPPQHFVQLHYRQRGVLCATAALCIATLQTKRCTMCHRSTLYSYITDKEAYYVPPQHFVQSLHVYEHNTLQRTPCTGFIHFNASCR